MLNTKIIRSTLALVLIALLAACNFNAERKVQIDERIKQLEKQIEARYELQIQDEMLLQTAFAEFQDSMEVSSSESENKMIRFNERIKPISARLDALKIQDRADQAEIKKLRDEYDQL